MSSPRLRPLFEKAGATFIDLPVLHPADPFLETAGEDIRRKMFVTEARTGERLALRPDFTIPVCLKHLTSGAAAARYAYEGVVFRRHDEGSPERLETGYEDIGRVDRADADAEALALAIAGAREVGAGELTVRLGDIGLFAALLAALGLPGRWRRKLRRSFGVPSLMATNLERLAAPREEERRLDPELRTAAERGDRNAFAAALGERLAAHGHADAGGRSAAEIVERFFDQRALPDAAAAVRALQTIRQYQEISCELAGAAESIEKFCADRRIDLGPALKQFSERAAAIEKLAPGSPIVFDAGFGRPLDYYTGLVFEIRSALSRDPMSGGGRYDRLIEMLGGNPMPAVGFMIRLDIGDGAA